MPDFYRAPASKLHDGRTVYLTPRGEETPFPGAKPVGLGGILDGTAQTIALLEVDDRFAVPWTKPDDWELAAHPAASGVPGQYPDGFYAAFCDGSVRFLPKNLDSATLQALFTRNGREKVTLPD